MFVLHCNLTFSPTCVDVSCNSTS